jgi:hypothetical protein
MHSDLASKISERVLAMSQELQRLRWEIKEHCEAEEYKFYSQQIMEAHAVIVLQILSPIYRQHPKLLPSGWHEGESLTE